MMACPYKARSFVHETITNQKEYSPRGKGTVESCTLCVHRIDEGGIPACAEACPEKAILFGDLNDANSDIAKRMAAEASTEVRGDLRLDLGVRYQGI
jgi:molybdopterin-containing oxidoreductase family iron-sulfur binding subunit